MRARAVPSSRRPHPEGRCHLCIRGSVGRSASPSLQRALRSWPPVASARRHGQRRRGPAAPQLSASSRLMSTPPCFLPSSAASRKCFEPCLGPLSALHWDHPDRRKKVRGFKELLATSGFLHSSALLPFPSVCERDGPENRENDLVWFLHNCFSLRIFARNI